MSSTPTSSISATQNTLKPNEYIRGLDQEHITKLSQDAYKHFTEYTKAELKMTVEDCQLLETMNTSTQEKYMQMSQMSQRLMKEMSKLQNTCMLVCLHSYKITDAVIDADADFSSFIQQIESIHQQSIEMENTAKALDEYSSYLVPQSTLDQVQEFNKYTVNTYARPDIVIARGKGCYLYDTNDRRYLDFTAGIAVTALGHSDPEVAQVLYKQANKLLHTSNLYHNEYAGALAKTMIKTTHQHGGKWASKLFLANSGTEANEGALKFARKWGKQFSSDKTEIVCFTNAFHGRSMGALSVTFNSKYQKPFAPLIPGIITSPYNDAEAALKAITDKTCGVIIEPIQGEGGVHPARAEFLETLRKRCDETNTLLIFDEIQCGLARTGKMWGHQHFDVTPDVLTMAKPLANGVPIGAIMTTEKVGEFIKTGEHGTTFGGNPLASAVALNVVGRITTPDFIASVDQKGEYLKSLLKQVQSSYPALIKEVRGKGLLIGVEFTKDPSPIVKMARERGLLVVTAGCNTVRVVPPLIITEDEAVEGVSRFAGAVDQFAIESHCETKLKNQPIDIWTASDKRKFATYVKYITTLQAKAHFANIPPYASRIDQLTRTVAVHTMHGDVEKGIAEARLVKKKHLEELKQLESSDPQWLTELKIQDAQAAQEKLERKKKSLEQEDEMQEQKQENFLEPDQVEDPINEKSEIRHRNTNTASNETSNIEHVLHHHRQMHDELTTDLSRMAKQLKIKSQAFGDTLSKDDNVLKEAQKAVESNLARMTKERQRLDVHYANSWGTSFMTIVLALFVCIMFVLVFFTIKFLPKAT
ncbi:hypothetical protein [Parasitella parasitica]|uniref:acetylornithine transaminase n=1 Tax=Parasitella parasitica TaxID=35722 RepID=A0A0B7MUF6_9FUNG|nr:hypothetical protein [Parasitella parasitica]